MATRTELESASARLIDAIEQLQPTADAKAEARRAHEQARSDVEAARI